MTPEFRSRILALSTEKALAVAAYGESVAAYRYRTLCEKAASERQRDIFEEMAVEEQGHHQRLQAMMKKYFPGSDFVLSTEDKELVTVGARMIDVHDTGSFQHALELIHASELQTGRFYACLHETTDREEFKGFLKEMADECFEHAKTLQAIPDLPT
jgi:rubrerythrin